MEPTSFNVGDLAPVVRCMGGRDASMEPTSFNVGDRMWRGMRAASRNRFNGADVFQRRRHGGLRLEFTPTITLQWSRRLSTSETVVKISVSPFGRCFNGADVFQRRRHAMWQNN